MAVNELPSITSPTEDVNTLANPFFVQASDGTDAGLNPGVDATNLGKAVDDVGGATDTGVASLAIRDDVLSAITPAEGDYDRLRLDGTGALWVNVASTVSPGGIIDDTPFGIAVDPVNPQGFLADEVATDSVDEGDIGIARMTLDRKQLNVLVSPTVDSQRMEINAAGEAQVDVASHGLTNANAVPISADNAANTELNPIFVFTVNTVTSGNEVHDYDTATVTAASSDTHDYTVTGTVFLWKSSILTSSGPFYFTLSSGPTAGTADFASAFLNGREGDTQQLTFEPAREVSPASTGVARITRFNRHSGVDNDVFTTIIGNDVA